MKILLADTNTYVKVTFEQVCEILRSGLHYNEWTKENLQQYIS